MDNRKVTQSDWTETTLEIEVPTPINTIRPGQEAPEAARPEGPLELVYPLRVTRVLYCEILTDRSKLDDLVRYRPTQGESAENKPNGRAFWPIEILAAVALIAAFALH